MSKDCMANESGDKEDGEASKHQAVRGTVGRSGLF